MAQEFTQYNLEPIGDSGIPTQPVGQSSAGSSSQPYTSNNDGSNLASRVESLEKYIQDIQANYAKKGGDANFNNVFVDNKLTAKAGNVAGWNVDTGVMSTNKLTIDSNNQWIRSNNYQTGVSGFTLQDNLVEAENAIIRGTIRGGTFAYDKINAVGGQLMVSNANTLALDMGALDADTMTTKDDTTFAVNDILVMRNTVGAGVVEEWFRVTAVSGNTYTVTRDLAGIFSANANPKWSAGTPVVKQGSSNGTDTYSGGWLRLIGEGTNAPYYSVFARNGVAYNAYTEVGRLGNLNGINGISTDRYGIFMGNSSTGNYLQYDDVSGEMVLNDTSLKFTAFFGDGSDGDVTISGNTTLTSDMYYNNLTVDNTYTLNTGGYRIFVKLTLTNNGTISRNGNTGGNGGNSTTSGAAIGTGGGTAGSALASGTLYGGLVGKVGGTISAGNGNNGASGDAQTESYASAGSAGGNGGAGAYNSGVGGSAGALTSTTQPLRNAVFSIPMANLTTATTIKTSSGSGSGGSGGQSGAYYGAGGGGSGSSGGIVLICAKKIINNGTISANGGNGGNGGAQGDGGNAGGGGAGGGGGIICLIYNSYPTVGTVTANGGTKGTLGSGGSGGATNGVDGVAGNIIYLPI